jgi:hypothetical protein
MEDAMVDDSRTDMSDDISKEIAELCPVQHSSDVSERRMV